ncbi:hypothetical protein [Amorphus sp. 3PC139-8]|uniref:hypothetical protein n=1 Tax=Amorphus sp. 3PC139-8 TaxID=2735676 RepID=UPI00345DEB5B
MADYFDIAGIAGNYRYFILSNPTSASIKPVAGNYMFIKPEQYGWVPVYIGVASNLSDRIPNHEMATTAARAGATHVAAHINANEQARLAEERDLIHWWQPVCNTQHRTQRRGLLG